MPMDPFELDVITPFGVVPKASYKPGDVVISQVSPGTNWLPADGRVITKASNPVLHAALPLSHPAPVKLGLPSASIQQRAVVYFNGTYFLVGYTSIYTSTDLVSFTVSNPLGNHNDAVSSPIGVLVIGAGGSGAFTSTGGGGWSTSTIASSEGCNSCAYGLSLFVVGCSSSGLKWSSSGTGGWNLCTSSDGLMTGHQQNFGGVNFINGMFVYCDSGSRLYTSVDGKAFTRVVGANNVNYTRMFYNTGTYYGSSPNSNVVQKSTNLVNWTTIYAPAEPIGYVSSDMLNGIYATSMGNPQTTPRFHISYNMVDFQILPMTPSSTSYGWMGADFANNKLFIIANDAANVVFAGAMAGPDDDKNLPLIQTRTPAWIKVS